MSNANLFNPQIVTGLVFVCVALIIVTILLAILVMKNAKDLKRLGERYDSFMMGKTSAGITIEQLLDDCLNELDATGKSLSALKQRVSSLEEKLPGCFQKIGVVRYNPFHDTGGDLSYVIALLDETNTGFILNGIYNRSGSYTYAKEIENGLATKHKLSPEELEALHKAANSTVGNRSGIE